MFLNVVLYSTPSMMHGEKVSSSVCDDIDK